MNDRPTPLELISAAHQALTTDVLPDAKPEQMYALRMIANALGIAVRELETSDKNIAAETRGLNALFGETRPEQDLPTRNRDLARAIRHGQFEGNPDQEAQLRQHLLTTARAKLAAAYPKGLEK